MTTQINELVLVWNQHTGQTLHPKAGERIFFEYLQSGFTADDLACVLYWIKRNNQKCEPDKRRHFNLRLVLRPYDQYPFEQFAIDLSEARAIQRNRVKSSTPKEEVLQQWRGIKPEGNGNCRSIKDFLKVPL